MREPQRDSLGREIRVDIDLVHWRHGLYVVLCKITSPAQRRENSCTQEHTRMREMKLRANMLPCRAW